MFWRLIAVRTSGVVVWIEMFQLGREAGVGDLLHRQVGRSVAFLVCWTST
jgi:hypothetical protein